MTTPMKFDEAWLVLKHKGPVNLPTVMQKVHRAWQVVKPFLTDYERMMIGHEMAPKMGGMYSSRRGFDIECQEAESRLKKIGLLKDGT